MAVFSNKMNHNLAFKIYLDQLFFSNKRPSEILRDLKEFKKQLLPREETVSLHKQSALNT
jgi:hypothetical protein